MGVWSSERERCKHGHCASRRIWLTPSSFPYGVEASHLAACRGSRVCFASYLAFHISVKSLGGARDIVLVRATVARERSMFQTMFSALLPISKFCLLFSVANFPFTLSLIISSSRSPRLTRSRVPSQLGDRMFGSGNSHFGVDGQMAAVVLRYFGKRRVSYLMVQFTLTVLQPVEIDRRKIFSSRVDFFWSRGRVHSPTHFCGLHSSPTFGLSVAEEFCEQEQFFSRSGCCSQPGCTVLQGLRFRFLWFWCSCVRCTYC